ncbi:GspE/PulE family protein [soil metagenome]
MEKAHVLRVPAGRPTNAIEAVDFIIATAIKMRASDIHLAPHIPTSEHPDRHLLRYRIFGKLQTVRANFLDSMYKEVFARLKVLAEISSADVGVPHDGQLSVSYAGETIVLRISTVPSQGHEELVVRVQRNQNQNLSINQLQMTEAMRESLKKVTQQKSGLIVLNGPAGSGKTTTIYSIINTLAGPEKKIITAEDPVETRLPYVNHTEVTSKTSFASLARAFMRQDADVIFLGEIRDEESAQTALQLAQTGHLVLTTIHSRDAVGVVSRLEALDIHPNNIATTLICSLGQRLIPSLCANCKDPVHLPDPTIEQLNSILEVPADTQFYGAGEGCDKCVGGYSGRIPLFELFVVDAEISDAINQRQSKLQLSALAREKGMSTLTEEALLRLYYGYTDLASIQSYVSSYDRS